MTMGLLDNPRRIEKRGKLSAYVSDWERSSPACLDSVFLPTRSGSLSPGAWVGGGWDKLQKWFNYWRQGTALQEPRVCAKRWIMDNRACIIWLDMITPLWYIESFSAYFNYYLYLQMTQHKWLLQRRSSPLSFWPVETRYRITKTGKEILSKIGHKYT